MKFDTPAGTNPIDQGKIVGKPVDRIDGPLKTTGMAPYAYEHHDLPGKAAYGHVVGAGIAKGTIRSIDLSAARNAPGVLGIVTAQNAGKLQKASSIPPSCWVGQRFSTTTRQLRWWWRRRLSRHARPVS